MTKFKPLNLSSVSLVCFVITLCMVHASFCQDNERLVEDFSIVADYFNELCDGALFSYTCSLMHAQSGTVCNLTFRTKQEIELHQSETTHACKGYCFTMLSGERKRRRCAHNCLHPKKQKRKNS